jgi:HK97 family phage major capsid protein
MIEEVKKSIEEMMTSFEEFKKTNDKRLEDLAKKGTTDPLIEQKLANLEKTLSGFETLNQKLTAAENERKAAAQKHDEETKELNKRLDEMALKIGRSGLKADVEELKARKAYFDNWLRGSANAITAGFINLNENQRKAIEQANSEAKSLNVTVDTAGGYLAPTEYIREIIKGVTEISAMRGLVRVRTTANKSVQLPKRTGQFAAQWVADQGTRSETTGLTYGLEEITLPEMYALVDISNQQLEDAAFDMEAEIRGESSEQFALAEGAALVSGNGVGRPQGFLSHDSVSETVSGSATAIAADGLINLFYGVKTAYAAQGSWVLNRASIGAIRKLKGNDNNYLWQPGLAQNVPNTILGASYTEVPDMPSEGAGTYPVAFGDWRRAYTLIDRIAMEMLRDPYTQATSGNVRFIFRRRLGGKVVLAEAIRKLKCST